MLTQNDSPHSDHNAHFHVTNRKKVHVRFIKIKLEREKNDIKRKSFHALKIDLQSLSFTSKLKITMRSWITRKKIITSLATHDY